MRTPIAVFPLLCLLSSACISLPDIEEAPPDDPPTDGGDTGDGGTQSDGGTDGGVDTTPPAVLRTNPPSGATRVPIDSVVQVDFSEEMQVSTLQVSSVPPASFTLSSWAAETRRAVFSASIPLAQDTQYTVTVEGTDLAGNSLSGLSAFTFTTVGSTPDTTPPTLLSVSPPHLSTDHPRDGNIKLVFSEPMNRQSVEQGFSIASPIGITGTFTWNDGGTEATFDPSTDFQYETNVTWYISSARDLAGNVMTYVVQQFRTLRSVTGSISGNSVDSILLHDIYTPRYDTWWIGDEPNNKPSRAFASFDLAPLANGSATRILSATLSWFYDDPTSAPFLSLGAFQVESVFYGRLGTQPYDYVWSRPPIGTPLSLGYGDLSIESGYCRVPVTDIVTEAWAHRTERNNLVQLRLRFESSTDNDSFPDYLRIDQTNLNLIVTYEAP